MHFNANEKVFTGLPRTGFLGSTASLTKEKRRRVGEHMSESLCACILMQNTLLEYTERVYRVLYIDPPCIGALYIGALHTDPLYIGLLGREAQRPLGICSGSP